MGCIADFSFRNGKTARLGHLLSFNHSFLHHLYVGSHADFVDLLGDGLNDLLLHADAREDESVLLAVLQCHRKVTVTISHCSADRTVRGVDFLNRYARQFTELVGDRTTDAGNLCTDKRRCQTHYY